jgi:amino acid adenylation domain-containing protein
VEPHLLQGLLRRAVARHPDRPAVVDGGHALSYAELGARSARLANLLLELGVRRGDRVAIYLDKSAASVVAIYGVLEAGGAYVPLDPQAPTSRLAFIARDCGVEVVLTAKAKAHAWLELVAQGAPIGAIVVLDATDDDLEPVSVPGVRIVAATAMDRLPASPPAPPTIDQDLAYILYTSGSTGVPKGVMLSHLNALTFVRWAAELCDLGPNDRLSSHAPLHFDLSIFDVFAAAAAGASVVLVPPQALVFPVEAARFIRDERITVWYSVPSALSMLVRRGGLEGGDFPTLRVLLFAGEVFPTKYLRRLMELLPSTRFVNLYGPTETNVCTFHEVETPPIGDEPIPIGTAIANTEVFVVADDGSPCRDGEVGELYVRGAGVMQGYWGDADRTSRSLVVRPAGSGPRDAAYRTGDLVHLDARGRCRLVGRRDGQIKSRGYRIELGDIEAALYAHPDVLECAVTATPDELITHRIRAHVVTRAPLEQAELQRFCGSRIPHYMVPESIEFHRELPKTSTGKVDRQVLSRT